MSYFKTYQVVDSSLIQDPFKGENIDEPVGLDSLEEIDEQIEFPKQKNKHLVKLNEDTAINKNKFYGIENENLIPFRKTEIKHTEVQLVEKLFNPSPKNIEVSNWQITLLLLAIILVGLSKAFSSNRFKHFLKAIINYTVAQEITREEKVFFHRSNLLLTATHILTTSLFLFQIREFININNFDQNNFLFFFLLLGVMVGTYIIKYSFSKVLFFILNDISISSEYIFTVSLYNNLLGVVFLPTLCLIYFSPFSFPFILFYFAIPIIFLTFVLRVIRLSLIGLSKEISYYYIFLYICTLEILPLVVLYRIFIH